MVDVPGLEGCRLAGKPRKVGAVSVEGMARRCRVAGVFVTARRNLVVCCASMVLILASSGGSSASAAPAGWSRPQAVVGNYRLFRLSCTTSRYCVGLGVAATGSTPETVVWNGKTWGKPFQAPSNSPVALQLLSCGSAGFCVASDGSTAWEWNGRSWSKGVAVIADGHGAPGEQLVGLACSAGGVCVAVDGQRKTFALRSGHWTATGSLAVLPPGASTASESIGAGGISCGSPTSCMIVDGEGFAYHWNGKSWKTPLDVLPPGNGFVSCPTAGWCMAMNAQSYEVAWSASGWGASPTFVDPRSMQLSQHSGRRGVVRWGQGDFGVLALSCGSASLCAAIDDAGYAVTYRSGRWSLPADIGPALDNVDTVTCSGSQACFAVSEGNVASANYS